MSKRVVRFALTTTVGKKLAQNFMEFGARAIPLRSEKSLNFVELICEKRRVLSVFSRSESNRCYLMLSR